MYLSIIIVNYNTQRLLLDCLGAIYNQALLAALHFEVIVVDNASSDGSVEALREKFDKIKLIVNKNNLGLAKAINQGLNISQGKYILLLSPDILFSSQTLIKMTEFMDQYPQAGAISPLLLDEEGNPRPLYGRFATFFSHLFSVLNIRYLIPDNLRRRVRLKIDHSCDFIAMDWLMSACLMLRFEAIKEVGQLDENMFFWFEDMELCHRLKDKDWKLYLIPKLSVIHIQHQGIKLLPERMRKAIYRKSALYFYYKRWFKSYLIKSSCNYQQQEI